MGEPTRRESDQVTLLVVDDDAPFRDALAAAFRRRGYDVRTAGSYDEAMHVCETFAPERAVVDLRMPGRTGIDVLTGLKKLDPETAVVLLTGFGSIPSAVEAVKLGAVHYLTKPAEPDEIESAFQGIELRRDREAAGALPSFDRASWEYVQRVLAEVGGNVSEAARRMGMHRRTLQRKLRKFPPPR